MRNTPNHRNSIVCLTCRRVRHSRQEQRHYRAHHAMGSAIGADPRGDDKVVPQASSKHTWMGMAACAGTHGMHGIQHGCVPYIKLGFQTTIDTCELAQDCCTTARTSCPADAACVMYSCRVASQWPAGCEHGQAGAVRDMHVLRCM